MVKQPGMVTVDGTRSSTNISGRTLRAYRYRSARDISQDAFADVLGVHRTYLGGLEPGEQT